VSGAPANFRRRVEVKNVQGLHARPAALLVQRARGFTSEVVLVLVAAPEGTGAEPGTRVDAKNVLDVMFLAAPCGTVLDVEASGPDAEAAVTTVAALFAQGFGDATESAGSRAAK
jgi:phosphotransferase system HPr (HPr) family protein